MDREARLSDAGGVVYVGPWELRYGRFLCLDRINPEALVLGYRYVSDELILFEEFTDRLSGKQWEVPFHQKPVRN